MEPLASLWLHSLRGVRGGLFTTEFARVDAVCSSRARAPLLRGARCVGVRGFFILLRTARHHSGATSLPSGPGATVGCSRLQPIWIKSPKPFCGPDPGVAGGVLAARRGSFDEWCALPRSPPGVVARPSIVVTLGDVVDKSKPPKISWCCF